MSRFPVPRLLPTQRLLGVVALLPVILGEPACAPTGQPPSFYSAPASHSVERAGQLIRYQELPHPPHASRAYRIVYFSTARDGTLIPVSGLAIVPISLPPTNGRAVVAWAHPTTGVQPRCAPSLSPLRFVMTPGSEEMIRRGYIVAATDYPGLGTAGIPSFLDGPTEARAVLDIVRASSELPQAAMGRRFALWGHSQGGQAVLFAAALAGTYAPDLKLVGVAAAAPATDLGTLFRDDIGSKGGNNLAALTLWAWNREYGADYSALVDPKAKAAIETIADKCIDTLVESPAKRRAGNVLTSDFLEVPDITAIEPWRSLIAHNSAPDLPAQIPVFLSQGGRDVVVRPDVTAAYAKRLCDGGSRVTIMRMLGVGHGWIAAKSAQSAASWIADRFDGSAQTDDCSMRTDESASRTPNVK